MAYIAPTIAQFQAQFVRDFPYGTDLNTCVLDVEIMNAFNVTDTMINQSMWPNQTAFQIGYGYLSAHYLVLNLRASSQGTSGVWEFLTTGKSVGPVNSSFQIPQQIIDNPNYAAYMQTWYGAMYINLLWPQLVGNTFTVLGSTRP